MKKFYADLLKNNPKLAELKRLCESIPKLSLEDNADFMEDGLNARMVYGILEIMKKKNITREQLSEKTKISLPKLNRLLNETTKMTTKTLSTIAVALEIEVTITLKDKGIK